MRNEPKPWAAPGEACRTHPQNVLAPRVGYYLTHPTGFHDGGFGAVAVVSTDQDPHQYERSIDVSATIALLRRAADELEEGNGTGAVNACGAAWFRLAAFHKEK